MGRRKFCLSKLPKNVERKCKGQRPVGWPRKSPCSAGVVRLYYLCSNQSDIEGEEEERKGQTWLY